MKQAKWMITAGYAAGMLGCVLGVYLVASDQMPAYWLAVWLAAHIFNASVLSAWLHRYVSHATYTTWRPIRLLMSYYSSALLYGSPHQWAVVHPTHHRYADTDKDTHIADWTYLFYKNFREPPKVTGRLKKVLEDADMAAIHRNGAVIFAVWAITLFMISPDLFLYGYLMPLGSVHLAGSVHQVLSHRGGAPRNMAWMELVLPLGGEWIHANHHDKPGRRSFRSAFWHLDSGAALIWLIRSDRASFSHPPA
jgi:stearoyl-CoA desaturase (delta-9 desaturase)